MLKRSLILFLIFYILILFQMSFLTYFEIKGQIPNLVLVFLFLAIFFNLSRAKVPWDAISAGFFMDLFSSHPIGILMFFLFLETLVIKRILKNLKEQNVVVFLLLFLLFQCFFYFFLSSLNYFLKRSAFSGFDSFFLAQIIYNLFFAFGGFYLFRILKRKLPI